MTNKSLLIGQFLSGILLLLLNL